MICSTVVRITGLQNEEEERRRRRKHAEGEEERCIDQDEKKKKTNNYTGNRPTTQQPFLVTRGVLCIRNLPVVFDLPKKIFNEFQGVPQVRKVMIVLVHPGLEQVEHAETNWKLNLFLVLGNDG
jgi:hypothetical protein